MERGKLYINENGVKFIPANGNVWLSEFQIAETFGVFVEKISSNIKAILISSNKYMLNVYSVLNVYHCFEIYA
jgi:hypothetical protein